MVTKPQRAILNRLDDGNRARRYGRGWCLMGWPFTLIRRRTWDALAAAGWVNETGEITADGRAALIEAR